MEARYSNSSAILDGKVTSWISPFKRYLQYLKKILNDPVVLDEGNYHRINSIIFSYCHLGIKQQLCFTHKHR